MSRITKMWKDLRWIYWMKIFITGVIIGLALIFVYEIATVKNELSEMRRAKADKEDVAKLIDRLDIITGEKDADSNRP